MVHLRQSLYKFALCLGFTLHEELDELDELESELEESHPDPQFDMAFTIFYLTPFTPGKFF